MARIKGRTAAIPLAEAHTRRFANALIALTALTANALTLWGMLS